MPRSVVNLMIAVLLAAIGGAFMLADSFRLGSPPPDAAVTTDEEAAEEDAEEDAPEQAAEGEPDPGAIAPVLSVDRRALGHAARQAFTRPELNGASGAMLELEFPVEELRDDLTRDAELSERFDQIWEARLQPGRARGVAEVEALIDAVRWLEARPAKDDATLFLLGWAKAEAGLTTQAAARTSRVIAAYRKTHVAEYIENPAGVDVYWGREFEQLIRENPGGRLAEPAAFALVVTHARGRHCEADLACLVNYLLRVISPYLDRYPDTARLPVIVDWLNAAVLEAPLTPPRHSREEGERAVRLLGYYTDALIDHGDPDLAVRGLIPAARALAHLGASARALEIYDHLLENAPNLPDRPEIQRGVDRLRSNR